MAQKEGPQRPRDQEVTLEQITKECLDAPGYVIFVGSLSRNRDGKGFNLINFKYRRFNFAFEDVKRTIEEFDKALKKDMASGA